jgi:hypothetical protein
MEERLMMTIEKVFHLRDGRTVMTGRVLHGPSLVRTIRCKLVVDGETRQLLEIEGEILVEKREVSQLRSVSTTEEVTLSDDEVEQSICELRQIGR